MKTCIACASSLDDSCFSRDRQKSDGLRTYCKECDKARYRRLKAEVSETVVPERKFCSSCNTTRLSAEFARRKASADGLSYKCKSCALVYQRDYSEKNRDVIAPKHKAYLVQYRADRPHLNRLYRHRRRAGGEFRCVDVTAVLDLQSGNCAACLKPLGQHYHLDHVLPVKLGGDNARSNLQILHPTCNLRKGAKHPLDWAKQLGRLF